MYFWLKLLHLNLLISEWVLFISRKVCIFLYAANVRCSSCSGHFVIYFWATILGYTSGLNLAADVGPVMALFKNGPSQASFSFMIIGLSFSNKQYKFWNKLMCKMSIQYPAP